MALKSIAEKQRLSPFVEFRKDGWPYCPHCEEDELYSYLAMSGCLPEEKRIYLHILSGMRCYRCGWTLEPGLLMELGREQL